MSYQKYGTQHEIVINLHKKLNWWWHEPALHVIYNYKIAVCTQYVGYFIPHRKHSHT